MMLHQLHILQPFLDALYRCKFPLSSYGFNNYNPMKTMWLF